MPNIKDAKSFIESAQFEQTAKRLYGTRAAGQENRYLSLIDTYEKTFGDTQSVAIFSSPGRSEICGNHTDHNLGHAIAASVNIDVVAVAAPNGENVVRLYSEGHQPNIIDLSCLTPQEEEREHSNSLIRGIAARFKELGLPVGGFNACSVTDVLSGSGLSSSAAFEVLVCNIFLGLFGGEADPVEIAKISQYSENVFFDKPCGLLDQTACAVGGFIAIDFIDPANPAVEKLPFDFEASGLSLCIIRTNTSHADLSGEYAAIPAEMKTVAAHFGKSHLRFVDESEFWRAIPSVKAALNNDRAVLRAIHFFNENRRVDNMVACLKKGDTDGFLRLVSESGRSSFMYLQNINVCSDAHNQGVGVALAAAESFLGGRGAFRVHGGGFAGTIQAFVPNDMLAEFKQSIDNALGEGSCMALSVRPDGAARVF